VPVYFSVNGVPCTITNQAVSNSSGVAIATLTSSQTAGTVVISASAIVNNIPVTSSISVSITPAPVATINLVSTKPTLETGGFATLAANLKKPDNTALTNTLVNFYVQGIGGSINPSSSITDSVGQARTQYTAPSNTGIATVMATANILGEIISTSINIPVNAPIPSVPVSTTQAEEAKIKLKPGIVAILDNTAFDDKGAISAQDWNLIQELIPFITKEEPLYKNKGDLITAQDWNRTGEILEKAFKEKILLPKKPQEKVTLKEWEKIIEQIMSYRKKVVGEEKERAVSKEKLETLDELLKQKKEKIAKIDLAIVSLEAKSQINLGEKLDVMVTLINKSTFLLDGVVVELNTQDGFSDKQVIALKPKDEQSVKFSWQPEKSGVQLIRVTVIPPEGFKDIKPSNNTAEAKVEVIEKEKKKPIPISEEKEPTEQIDLSLERIETKGEILLNEKTELTVWIRNKSKSLVEKCAILLETEDGFQDKKVLAISPNKLERVSFSWTPRKEGKQKIIAYLEYPQDADPKNNKITEIVEVKGKKEVDLSITDIRLRRIIIAGEPSDIEVSVKNDSGIEIREALVILETEDGFRDKKTISLRPYTQERIRFTWTPHREGRQRITATLECREDQNPRNNSLSQEVEVRAGRGGER